MYLKKEGKIAKVYRLSQEGVNVKEIAEKTKLSERIVRAYIWRVKNPEKYKALVKRYFEKKKGKEVLATEAERKPVEAQKKERKSQQTQ
jgi:predicted transcriptional regulator